MVEEVGGEIGVTQAARKMEVTLDYVYSLVRAGRLRARKVDGRWLISVAAIEERLAARRGEE